MAGEFDTPPQPPITSPGAGTAPPPAAPVAPAAPTPPPAPPAGGGTPAPVPGAAGPQQPVTQPVTPPNPGAPGAPPAPQAQQFTTAREYAASLGFTAATQHQNDQDFLRSVVQDAQRARELQQIQPYAQEYMRNHREFSEWQRQQQAAAAQQQQPQQPAKWWNPPEYNASWEQAVVRDAQGNISVRPGQDPSILPRYLAYHSYRQDFANRFLQDPGAALGPAIDERARTLAQEIVRTELGQYQAQREAESYLEQNAGWLYQTDPTTNRFVYGQDGQRQLSPIGKRFAQHYQNNVNQRVPEQAARQLAYVTVQNELLAAQFNQQQQQVQQHTQDMNLLTAGAEHNPSRAGVLFQPVVPGAGPAPTPTGSPAPGQAASLRDMLAIEFKRNGITDADFR